MSHIDRIASSQGVDWRTLMKLMPGAADQVADALCTRKRFRTDEQRGIIAAAQQIAESDADREKREKRERRQRGVNDLETGRVNGRTLEGGQPRRPFQTKRRKS